MARCVKVDDHEDYHHHCYGDYYVSVSVDPFEHGHRSLPFLKCSLVPDSLASKITAVSGALPCDKLGHFNFQIRTDPSELGQYPLSWYWPEPATRKSKSGQWNRPNWDTLASKLGQVG
jgi:hypothetical protein